MMCFLCLAFFVKLNRGNCYSNFIEVYRKSKENSISEIKAFVSFCARRNLCVGKETEFDVFLKKSPSKSYLELVCELFVLDTSLMYHSMGIPMSLASHFAGIHFQY